MNKRRFIQGVRDYGSLAQRNRRSYAEQVNTLFKSYMDSRTEAGASDVELTKDGDWAEAFLWREYAVIDKEWTPSTLA